MIEPAQFSRSFLGGAISTATSPLRSAFSDATCRSPVTPRRPSRLNGDSTIYVDVDRLQEAVSADSPSSPTQRSFPKATSSPIGSGDTQSKRNNADTRRLKITLLSPTGSFRISPQTPQLLYHSPRNPQIDPEANKIGTISAISLIIGKCVGVGVYSVPSSIFVSVGSVGMSILVWVFGAAISFCGLAVYLDLGTAIPKSGGERVYLERIFRKPRMLASCMFGAYVVLLGFSTPNCIVLAEYVMYAVGVEINRWNVRSVAVVVITLLCAIHARYPKFGLKIVHVLGLSQMLILVIFILAGIAGMAMGVGRIAIGSLSLGGRRLEFIDDQEGYLSTAQRNFSNIWANSSTQPYDYATALLKVLYCFRGYSTANQVLSSVRRPVQTLQMAAPIALGLVSFGYIAANIAYFLAVEKEDFRTSGVVVAGHFFKNVFGVTIGERILPCFVVVSAFGNVAATSFAQARVNQELGKDGLLPFSRIWEGHSSGGALDSPPTRGLFLHWLISVLVIVVPPRGSIYNFLVDIGGYPISVISVGISVGLLYLQIKPSENWHGPFRARKVYIVIFAGANMLLLILPWIKPKGGRGEEGKFPYFAYPATALAILGLGVLWWIWLAKIKSSCAGGRGWTKGHKLDLSGSTDGSLALRRMKKLERTRGKENREGRNSQETQGLLSQEVGEDDKTRLDGDQEGLRKRAPCGCPLDHDSYITAKPSDRQPQKLGEV